MHVHLYILKECLAPVCLVNCSPDSISPCGYEWIFLKCGQFNSTDQVWERLPMVAQKEGGCLSNASGGNHQCSLIMAEGLTDMQWVVVGPKGAI